MLNPLPIICPFVLGLRAEHSRLKVVDKFENWGVNAIPLKDLDVL
jgi:hypothetical protein